MTSSDVNLSQDVVKGLGFNGRYARDLSGGQFIFNAHVTKYTGQSSKVFPEEYLNNANGIVIAPDWTGTFDVNYAIDNITFRYGIDWTDSAGDATYEYFAFDELTGVSDSDDVQAYKGRYSWNVNDYFLHNASVQLNVQDYQFTFGVRNIL